MKTLLFGALLLGMLSGCGLSSPDQAAPKASAPSACTLKADTVVAERAMGATWIPWESDCLPDARVAYIDRLDWEIWVMDENGEHKRCLTCYDDNVVGVNFPLDGDGQPPGIHWKGDPEAHPTLPIIFMKAENEYSEHRALRNAPSIGWDNDLWALNVCTRRYSRLTRLARNQGLQHTAISEDGAWYVYPLRLTEGAGFSMFQYVKMMFGTLSVSAAGDAKIIPKFEQAPLGELYYEPNDIYRSGDGRYSLYYAAGRQAELDPYRLDWCDDDACAPTNVALQPTPGAHEEFLMISPSGRKLAWMQGPLEGFGYHADLFVSALDFTEPERITWYNDCKVWPDQCLPYGGQLSRLAWSGDGRSIFFGLWEHGAGLPFNWVSLHRLDFEGACGGSADEGAL